VLDHYASKIMDIPAEGDMEEISQFIRQALTKVQQEKFARVFHHYQIKHPNQDN
jgi:hypothetical protein